VQLKVSAGVAQVGSMVIALDKALTSPGPYDDIEAKRGGGAHHLAFLVDDLVKAEAQMRERGYGVILSGHGIGVNADGGGSYFDTIEDMGTVIEFAQVPREMPAPDAVYPAEGKLDTGGKVGIKGAVHLAIAVRDAEKAARNFEDLLGIGPWQIVTFGSEVSKATYQGKEVSLSLKVAAIQLGPFMLALEQPLSSPSPLQDFLDKNGQGIHHVCLAVDEVGPAAAEMERLGYKKVFTASGFGPNKDGEAAYFDTEKTLGITIELAKVPTGM
jgi:catechol 2,3-dioxygenase-like lactoylglutathione lyase family enzyme